VDVVVRQLGLPVEDVLDGLEEEEFFIPGSLMRIRTDAGHPLAWGMPEEGMGARGYAAGSSARRRRASSTRG